MSLMSQASKVEAVEVMAEAEERAVTDMVEEEEEEEEEEAEEEAETEVETETKTVSERVEVKSRIDTTPLQSTVI